VGAAEVHVKHLLSLHGTRAVVTPGATNSPTRWLAAIIPRDTARKKSHPAWEWKPPRATPADNEVPMATKMVMRRTLANQGVGPSRTGWQSFVYKGVHVVGLVNVLNYKAGGLGSLGTEQIECLENDSGGLGSSTPTVVVAHVPLWAVYPKWRWVTTDAGQALGYLKRFGSVSVPRTAQAPSTAKEWGTAYTCGAP
jgi:hypothetical protein